MKNKKKSKLLPIAIVLSVVMCVSAFIGGTYAWFSDREASDHTRIVGGNLDVELYWADWDPATGDLGDFARVTEDTNDIFDATELYEPGHTTVKYFKVVNAGTLALKYQLSALLGENEIGSINMYGEPFKLSDHMVFKFIDIGTSLTSVFVSREQVWTAACGDPLPTTEEGFGVGFSNPNITDKLLPGANAEHYYALVVFMPTVVGNVANYMTNENPPQITMDINLVASQTPYENDSFGDDYDAFADMQPDNEWSSFNVASGNLPQTIVVFDDEGREVLKVTNPEDRNATVIAARNIVPAGIAAEANSTYICYDIRVELEGDEPITQLYTVEMFIGRGIEDASIIKLYHNTTDVTASIVSYNTDTGMLVFTTDSFSPFTVKLPGIIAMVNDEYVVDGSLRSIFSNAPDEALIRLTAYLISFDGVAANKVIVNKTATLDLNGCMVSVTNNVENNFTIWTVTNTGNFSIIDNGEYGIGLLKLFGNDSVNAEVDGGENQNSQIYILTSSGNTEIKSGSFVMTSDSFDPSGFHGNGGSFIMSGGSVNVTASDSARNAYGIRFDNNCNGSITGGTITVCNERIRAGENHGSATGIRVTESCASSNIQIGNVKIVLKGALNALTGVGVQCANGMTTINAGTEIKVSNFKNAYGVYSVNNSTASVVINDGVSIKTEDSASSTVMYVKKGNLTVNGGVFEANATNGATGININGDGSVVTVNGGSIKAASINGTASVISVNNDTATATVSGVTLTAQAENANVYGIKVNKGALSIGSGVTIIGQTIEGKRAYAYQRQGGTLVDANGNVLSTYSAIASVEWNS